MFSEKYGYKSPKAIQHEYITDELRCRIWNLFHQQEIKAGGLGSKRLSQAINGQPTIEEKIMDRLGYLIDSSDQNLKAEVQLKNGILMHFEWYEIYDFIDTHLSFLCDDELATRTRQYNEVLEQEKSGYRIVAGEIAPITNTSEIYAIEEAATTPYQSVNQHIRKALALYSDLKTPDYENSVKESISSVEAMCCIITGMTGAQATLGKALKKLEDAGVRIHASMKNAFSSLYGYTSDEDGIRHGGIDFTNVPAEDAKYMLVSCSAFVNYLIEKWSKLKS